MLTIFFTIIFISELVITVWIISLIRKFNKEICITNQKVLDIKPELETQLQQVKLAVNTVLQKINSTSEGILEKEHTITNFLANEFVIGTLFFLLKSNGKGLLAIISLLSPLKKLLKLK